MEQCYGIMVKLSVDSRWKVIGKVTVTTDAEQHSKQGWRSLAGQW